MLPAPRSEIRSADRLHKAPSRYVRYATVVRSEISATSDGWRTLKYLLLELAPDIRAAGMAEPK
jgi:hypothetical protein